ncbi:MAG TPA: hypothetical protein DCQ52_15865 [Acidimicrobiaceae bacterium]|nr:hypothetical protein [Acidimicrobiaceae bacterium]
MDGALTLPSRGAAIFVPVAERPPRRIHAAIATLVTAGAPPARVRRLWPNSAVRPQMICSQRALHLTLVGAILGW